MNTREFDTLVKEHLPPAMGFKINRSEITDDYELVFFKNIIITETAMLPSHKLVTMSAESKIKLINDLIESLLENTNEVERFLTEGKKP